MLSKEAGPIGVFDSGYGGLTILHGIRQLLPQYDYLYLGDNARAPYGPRSFDVVYEFTRQAVHFLFERGCQLVILGCNTASAKALRSIQQIDLPKWDADRRVLGVIRPTAEVIGQLTTSRHVGVLAIKKRIDQLMRLDPEIDAIILGCTHYPLLMPKILKYIHPGVRIVAQGEYVAEALDNYLQRHTKLEQLCSRGGSVHYLTTENPETFSEHAQIFLHEHIEVEKVIIDR